MGPGNLEGWVCLGGGVGVPRGRGGCAQWEGWPEGPGCWEHGCGHGLAVSGPASCFVSVKFSLQKQTAKEEAKVLVLGGGGSAQGSVRAACGGSGRAGLGHSLSCHRGAAGTGLQDDGTPSPPIFLHPLCRPG